MKKLTTSQYSGILCLFGFLVLGVGALLYGNRDSSATLVVLAHYVWVFLGAVYSLLMIFNAKYRNIAFVNFAAVSAIYLIMVAVIDFRVFPKETALGGTWEVINRMLLLAAITLMFIYDFVGYNAMKYGIVVTYKKNGYSVERWKRELALTVEIALNPRYKLFKVTLEIPKKEGFLETAKNIYEIFLKAGIPLSKDSRTYLEILKESPKLFEKSIFSPEFQIEIIVDRNQLKKAGAVIASQAKAVSKLIVEAHGKE